MTKRLIVAVICIVLFVSLSLFGTATSTFSAFPDITETKAFTVGLHNGEILLAASSNTAYTGASSWAIPELDKASGYGFITDKIKNNMSANITREEFAEIAVKLYEKYTAKKALAGNAAFSDTTNQEILKAANLGLIKGIGDGKFGPKQLVTREQMATILLRALQIINPDTDYSIDSDAFFSDNSLIDSWAQQGVYYCASVGIIKGILNKDTGVYRFDPDGNSSREVAVIVCTRAYEQFTTKTDKEDPVKPKEPESDDKTPPPPTTIQGEAWNGGIIILDNEFKQEQYELAEIDGQSYIFLSYDRFQYVFKMPGSKYSYPEVSNRNGQVTIGWKDDQGQITLDVVMKLNNPVALVNGEEVDIVKGPYQKGDIVYVPVNLFFAMFDMKSEIFCKRLCFQYADDFPQEVLQGSWSYSYIGVFTGYKDLVSGVISLPSFDWSYTFNADGTYQLGAVSSGGYQSTLILQSGKYKVIGNVIIYYDVYETLYKGKSLALQYEKKFMGDRLEYSFIDNYNAEEDKIELDLTWLHRSE